MSAVNGQRADNRALSDDEQQLLRRLLSDPFSFPLEFKQWLVNFLESSDMILPRGSIHGLRDGRTPPTEWEDVGTSGGPGGGGIQFDTAPQIGGWLSIRTTGKAPDTVAYTNGYSIGLWAHDPGDGTYPGGIDLIADNPDTAPNEIQVGAMNSYNVGIGIYSHRGLELSNDSDGTMDIRHNSSDGPLIIQARSTGGLEIKALQSDLNINANAGTLYLSGKFANFGFTGDAFTDAFHLRTVSGKMTFADGSGHGIEFSGYSFLVDTHFESVGNNISLKADRILLDTIGGGNGDIQINAEKTATVSSNSVNVQLLANAGVIAMQASSIQFNSFGQKGTVTTLSDVIALLQSYGLAA